jgi:Cu2+-exporting ATPase
MTACFHCGLPVPERVELTLAVFGTEQAFCCAGCRAVCKAIVDNGLEDYYRHRERPAERVDRRELGDLLNQLTLYDRPEIQREFVRGDANGKEAHLILEEIRCPACLWLNEQHLRRLPGVLEVDIDYTSQRARVRWDPERTELSRILQAVRDIGYAAHPFDPSHRAQLMEDQRRRSWDRLLFAGILGMVMMNFAFATYVMGAPDPTTGEYELWVIIGRWTALFVTVGILAYPGAEFLIGAWRDLRHRRLGMDVPIAIGLLTAFTGSVVATVSQRGEVYYDSIAMFVFFLLLARRAEMKARERAAARLDTLARIVPRTARRLGAGHGDEEVALAEITPGDRVRVLPGETVPIDGRILTGTSSFNEALLSGEARPVTRRPGDRIVAGAINIDQPIVIEATCASTDSTLSQIQGLLQRGLRSRPRFAILAERVASWFVAVALGVAAATAGLWLWLEPAQALPSTVAVLIVTCPCALALATPVALTIGSGRFALMGVFPLRMNAIEALASAEVAALDKTGTLTLGRPTLVSVHTTGDLDQDSVRALAAALSQHSEHPVAQALRAPLTSSAQPPDGPINVPGQGIEGRIDEAVWRLGSLDFIAESYEVKRAHRKLATELRRQDLLVSGLGGAGKLQAIFALRDEPRPGLSEMTGGLRAGGVHHCAIVSGDNPLSVERLGSAIGADEALGGQSPEAKLAWITAKQDRGWRVMMIGDGVNDAPTLAAADVSLSFQSATELAQAHSDFLILASDLGTVPAARRLAQRTRRIIRQNLVWAAGYNLSAIPAAALGLIPPWGAAIGMSLSSLLVVGNSLRLQGGTGPVSEAEAPDAMPAASSQG